MASGSSMPLYLLMCFLLWVTQYRTASASNTGNLTKEDASLVINGASYSLLERPLVESDAVRYAQERLTMYTDIHALSEHLKWLAEFVRTAYIALPPHATLRVMINELALQVNDLGTETVQTIMDLYRKSEEALNQLEFMFELVYENEEEEAGDRFDIVSQLTNVVIEKTKELHTLYRQDVHDVKKQMIEMEKRTAEQENNKQKLDQKMKEYEIELSRSETNRDHAGSRSAYYDGLFEQKRQKEEESISALNSRWNRFFNSLLGLGGLEWHETVASEARMDMRAHSRDKQQYEERYVKATNDIEEYTIRLKQSSNEQEAARVTISALHETLGGLKAVYRLVDGGKMYWESLQALCEEIAEHGSDMAIYFESLEGRDEKRMKMWRSKWFKTRAYQFYSDWVALNDIAKNSAKGMRPALEDLREVVTTNPTEVKFPQLGGQKSKDEL